MGMDSHLERGLEWPFEELQSFCASTLFLFFCPGGCCESVVLPSYVDSVSCAFNTFGFFRKIKSQRGTSRRFSDGSVGSGAWCGDGGVFITQNKEGLLNECEGSSALPLGHKDGDVIFP